MKITHRPLLLATAGLILLAGAPNAHAQREAPTRDERRAERRQANETLTPEQQQANRESRMQERMKSATPEQRARFEARRAEFQQRMQEAGIDPNDPNAMQKARDAGLMGNRGGGNNSDAMRQMMEKAGITDKDVQDAIIAYVAEQNQARVPLLQLAQTAAQALQTPLIVPIDQEQVDVEAVNAKVATTFDAYQTAFAAEDARQKAALKALDEKIHYTTTPRIKSFLSLVGILDNDVLAIGGPAAVFNLDQGNGGGTMQVADNGGDPGQGRGQGRGRNRNDDNADQAPAQETEAPAEPVVSKPVRIINR